MKRENYKQIKFNYAYYYQLQDGRILIDPAVGKVGLIVKDEETFEAMVEAKWFPVPDDGSFFAPERNQIKSIQDSISIYLESLKPFGVIDIDNIQNKVETLKILSKGFNNAVPKNNSARKVDHKILVALGCT